MATRIFIFEFVAGGGWHASYRRSPTDSLLSEGRAMLWALASDFAAAGCEVIATCDPRDEHAALPAGIRWIAPASTEQLERTFQQQGQAADWTVVIAPEFDGHLARWADFAQRHGRLLGGSLDMIALCSDKHATAEHLSGQGIRAPQGMRCDADLPVEWLCFPAVMKPCDGAGSCDVRRIDTCDELSTVPRERAWRLENFCPGQTASVSLIAAVGQLLAFPPSSQLLQTADKHLQYVGGGLPLPDDLAARAVHLATRAARCLPQPLGYLGVDLVLGSADDGSLDTVIEINPRLTTSYIGLRALCRDNLARAMLDLAEGKAPELRFDQHAVRFDVQGRVFSDSPGLSNHVASEQR